MPANSVYGHVRSINFKVKPIETERLHKSQDSFAKEGIQAEGGVVLVDQSDHTITKDERHEGVSSLNLMLDVKGRPKLKCLLHPATDFVVYFWDQPYEQ